MQPNIELQKARDFGEIINDTFIFVRQNIKYLLKYFFIFCGFFILAITATTILQQIKTTSALSNIDPNSFTDATSRFAMFGLTFFLNILFIVLGYTAITVTVLCYVTLYKIKGNIPPDTEEMWGYFKFYYIKSMLSAILLGIFLIVGLVFCFIPGIYLYPIFALVLPIMIIENTTFGFALSHSFKLIKDNWWLTFGTLFVIIIITSVAGMIVTVPAMIMNAGNLLFHITQKTNVSIITIVIATVLQQIATVLQIIPAVGIAMCYFSLTENKEGSGLLGRIQDFGTGKPGPNATPEEY